MNNKKKEEEKSLTSGFRKRKNKETANESFAKQLLKIPRLTSFFASKSNTQYPSDFANFKDVITVEKKQFILSVGPCRPEGPFPKDDKNPRKKNNGWIRGINDWQGLSKKIKKHEISEVHINTCFTLKQWKEEKTIDTMLLDNIQKEQTSWAKVLERLTNITLKLAKNCSSFREQNGSLEDIYNGNFLSDVQLLAEYDIVLKEVISLPRGHVNYLLPQIQNEIICLLSKNLERKVINDINLAPFFE
ncbi:uncharacterized protein LOC136072396 [Hydra vulgaris]|uniref:uncharacterized protein LOC136072396 n=1 Tax=Hydra vulgaris TaxID=6087 RepID=UPI0032E9C77A